jgi:glycosyltransferase involved in cell wall biosynthesis
VSISVIVRTINRRALLNEALESLAQQTYRSFEVVIVDMSGGHAASIVKRHNEQLPRTQHLQTGKRLSRAAALNEGIRHARADKIAILDDDNLYDPGHLETLVAGLEQTRADLVYTGVRRTTYTPMGQCIESVKWHDPFDFSRLLFDNYVHTSGTAFWKSTWERVGGYDLRFPVYEDHDFLLRVGSTGRIARLPAITAESRSFTGQAGMQNHALEAEHVRYCRAGIYWVHRRLLARERFQAHAESRANRARFLRVTAIRDLLGWWWHFALPYRGARGRFGLP